MGNVTQAYVVKLSTPKEEECAMGKEGGALEDQKSQIWQSLQVAAFLYDKSCQPGFINF